MPTGISEAESFLFICPNEKGNNLYIVFLGYFGQLKFSELLYGSRKYSSLILFFWITPMWDA